MSKSDTNPQNNQPVHVKTPVVFSSDGSQDANPLAGKTIVVTGSTQNNTATVSGQVTGTSVLISNPA